MGIEIFAKYLEKCPNIETLNLQGNSLAAPSAEKISTALSASESLKYLNLQNNKVGTAGAIVKYDLFRALPRIYFFRVMKNKECPWNN